MFENATGYTYDKSYGYSTALPCQNFLSVVGDSSTSKVVTFYLDPSLIDKFMRSASQFNSLSGTGFNGNKFIVLAQKTAIGDRPIANQWKAFDYTSRIDQYSTWSGTTIPPANFENTAPFRIDNNAYTGATTFNLADYITIPTNAQPNNLQFGDEVFFYGNVKTNIEATVFKTKMLFNLMFPQFNTTTNPTWDGIESIYISEVGIYSANNELVAVAKLSYPIQKTNAQVRMIELSIDF